MIVVQCLLATIRLALPSWVIEAFSSLRPRGLGHDLRPGRDRDLVQRL